MAYANSFHQSCTLIINEWFILLLYFLKIKKKGKKEKKVSLKKKKRVYFSLFAFFGKNKMEKEGA